MAPEEVRNLVCQSIRQKYGTKKAFALAAGVTPQNLSEILSCGRYMPYRHAYAISKLLDLDYELITTGKEEPDTAVSDASAVPTPGSACIPQDEKADTLYDIIISQQKTISLLTDRLMKLEAKLKSIPSEPETEQ